MTTAIERKIADTWAAIAAEAERRGLEVVQTPYSGKKISGVGVSIREQRTPDPWNSRPTGKISVRVSSIYVPNRVSSFPTKTFPEGKNGVNIAKVLDRVEECVAKRQELAEAEAEKSRAASEAAEAEVLVRRKAAAWDEAAGLVAKWREEAGTYRTCTSSTDYERGFGAGLIRVLEQCADQLQAALAQAEAAGIGKTKCLTSKTMGL